MASPLEAPQGASKAKRYSARRLFANLSASAAFRKGRGKAKDEPALVPELEAHLCQLAALENYADHGMLIKFSDEEARSLESKALDIALDESKAVQEATLNGKPIPSAGSRVNSHTLSKTEVDQFLARLRTDDDPLFTEVANSVAAGEDPVPDEALRTSISSGSSAAAAPEGVRPPPKMSTFSAFKRRLVPKLRKANKSNLPPVPRTSNELPPGTLGHGYSPGSYDHFAAEAQEQGMEYSNGYIFPKDYIRDESAAGAGRVEDLEDERLRRAMALSAVRDDGHDRAATDSEGALLEVAMEVSRTQTEFDNVLRDARMLRRDLEHEQGRCCDKQQGFELQGAELEQRKARLAGRQGPPPHLSRQCAEALHNAAEARSRAESLGEAVEELGHLEAYIRDVKPPKRDAIVLTEEIVRELLKRLNFKGFDFFVPPDSQKDAAADVQEILARYRGASPKQPAVIAEAPAKTPELPDTSQLPASTSVSPQVTPEPLPRAADATPTSSGTVSSPAFPHSVFDASAAPPEESAHVPSPPTAPSTPVREAAGVSREPLSSTEGSPLQPSIGLPPLCARRYSSSEASEREARQQTAQSRATERMQSALPAKKALGVNPRSSTHSRPASSRMSRSASSALSVSSAQSSEDGRKGPSAPKRNSQVVHLFNEMRKVMPEAMDTMYAFPEPPEVASARRDAKINREKQAAARAKAESPAHAQLLNRLAGIVKRCKPNHPSDAYEIVVEVEAQLSHVASEPAALLLTCQEWPEAKWAAVKEAADVFAELQGLSGKLELWSIGQGSNREEAMAMEVFFDTARLRVEDLQRCIKSSEKRWAAQDVRWDASIVRHCRQASLHLAALYMSRALADVADHERSQALKSEACIGSLADAIRVAYKVHQFAGGFNQDTNELFDKVKRLAQFYVRRRDPTWLREASRF